MPGIMWVSVKGFNYMSVFGMVILVSHQHVDSYHPIGMIKIESSFGESYLIIGKIEILH